MAQLAMNSLPNSPSPPSKSLGPFVHSASITEYTLWAPALCEVSGLPLRGSGSLASRLTEESALKGRNYLKEPLVVTTFDSHVSQTEVYLQSEPLFNAH